MATKELRIFNNDNLDQERDHILQASVNYGYKKVQASDMIWNVEIEPLSKEEDTLKLVLMYIQGVIDKIAKILREK